MRPDGEFGRIAALLQGLPMGEGVVLGPGDDAAVLRPSGSHDLVATTDAFVEGRHFERDRITLEAIGARLAAANLSDLAAMAAQPRWALLSWAIPSNWSEHEVRAIQQSAAVVFAAEAHYSD